jgi:hypothetical protein
MQNQNNLRYWKSKTKLPLVQLVDDVPAVDTKATPEYLLSEKVGGHRDPRSKI